MGGRKKHRRHPRRIESRRIESRLGAPTLDQMRDAVRAEKLREIQEDRAERRRQRLRDMGFSEAAVRERDGVVAAFLEDISRHHHGVDPRKSGARKSGRRRRQRGATAIRPGYPHLYGEG